MAFKDFTPYAKATTAQIAEHCRSLATQAGRPVISFDHVKTRGRASFHKDELAKSIATRDGVTEGIICLISARLYRVTHYGNQVLTAAISLHDDRFPERYLAAA